MVRRECCPAPRCGEVPKLVCHPPVLRLAQQHRRELFPATRTLRERSAEMLRVDVRELTFTAVTPCHGVSLAMSCGNCAACRSAAMTAIAVALR